MSAFAGFVSLDGSNPPSGTDDRLAQSLDGDDLRASVVRRMRNAVLVFRQRVLSPEDRFERQPAIGESGAVSLFDGRLDNRGELIGCLGLRNPGSSAVPDGDLVLAAYERWGAEAAARLLGDYAWAVWDARAARLMLTRDHSFQRNLYYCRGRGFVAFATGYRPLLALPQVPRDIEELAVADLLLVTPDDGERSFYKGISWVGSAMRTVVTAEGVRSDRLWEPGPRPPVRLSDDGEYAEAARAVFEEAVRCRLRIAGPVASTVSSGLDSSAVAVTAARLRRPDPVHGICIVPAAGAPAPTPADRHADESPQVALLAARNPNLHVDYVSCNGPEVFESDASAVFLRFGAPMWSPNTGGWFLTAYRQAAALGARTLLLGVMGNLTYSADGYCRLTALGRAGRWPTFLREWLALGGDLRPGGRRRQALLALLPPRLRADLRRLRHGPVAAWTRVAAPLNPDFVREAGLAERYESHGFGVSGAWAADSRVQDLRLMLMRSRMAAEAGSATRLVSGVTGSDPFSDRRLIDFCLSLPDDQFMRDGRERRLARAAFADRLPPEILDSRSRGQQNADWHARLSPQKEAIAAELERLDRSVLAARLLDLPRLKRAFASWPADADEALRTRWLETNGLFRAMHIARFLRWIEGGNG